LSQPAVSNALARLRRQFDDALLVRKGSVYELTPFAEQLLPSVREAVHAASAVSVASTQFDPASSTRQFTVAASDYAQTVVGCHLLREVRRRAPLVNLAFVSPFSGQFRHDEDILEGADGWFAPREMLPGRDHIGSVTDRWVCVVARDHPAIGEALTLEDAETYGWVAPAIRGKGLRLHLDGLAAHGVVPRFEVVTDSFSAVPFLVAGSDRIGILQGALAGLLSQASGIRVVDCPWEVQPLYLTFWWSANREGDLGHAWLRGVVQDCFTEADVGIVDGGAP
jgi:DNA-binding transcriptional LysR family regulator